MRSLLKSIVLILSPGIGLMMATALENNGATVYIIGRRPDVLQKAAKEHNVSISISEHNIPHFNFIDNH